MAIKDIVAKHKAKQISEAEEQGLPNPYSGKANLEDRKKLYVQSPRQEGKTAVIVDHYIEAMKVDGKRLKDIDDIEERNRVKKELIAGYRPLIAEAIKGRLVDSDLISELLIWLFDIDDIEAALKLGFVLVDKGLNLPPRFDRTMETFICDTVYDWAAKLLKAEPPQSASPYIDNVVNVMDKQHWDLNPIVRGKMYAMLAKHKFNDKEYALCVELCDKAEAENPKKSGTIKLKQEAEQLLKQA